MIHQRHRQRDGQTASKNRGLGQYGAEPHYSTLLFWQLCALNGSELGTSCRETVCGGRGKGKHPIFLAGCAQMSRLAQEASGINSTGIFPRGSKVGPNKRGRPCREWMDDIVTWCKTGLQELNSFAQDRRRWKLITGQAMDTNGRWSHGS